MNEERRAYWSKLIAEHKASGASLTAFCKQRGISAHSFYSWRRRLRQTEPVEFALVKTVGVKAEPSLPLELFLPGGERLSIPTGMDATTLRTVLDALRA